MTVLKRSADHSLLKTHQQIFAALIAHQKKKKKSMKHFKYIDFGFNSRNGNLVDLRPGYCIGVLKGPQGTLTGSLLSMAPSPPHFHLTSCSRTAGRYLFPFSILGSITALMFIDTDWTTAGWQQVLSKSQSCFGGPYVPWSNSAKLSFVIVHSVIQYIPCLNSMFSAIFIEY